MKKNFIKYNNLVLYFIIIIFVILMLSSKISFFGSIKAYDVMSASMSPNIKIGSLIFDINNHTNLKSGDIVSYKDSINKIVTHRIIGIVYNKGKVYYIVKGDANDLNDFELISKNQIVGKTVFKISYLGYLIYFAKTIPGLVISIIIPATIIIYEEIIKIKKESSRLKRKHVLW